MRIMTFCLRFSVVFTPLCFELFQSLSSGSDESFLVDLLLRRLRNDFLSWLTERIKNKIMETKSLELKAEYGRRETYFPS